MYNGQFPTKLEVEQNVVVGRTQSESFDYWKICDILFPSMIAKRQLSLAENIKYRLVSLSYWCNDISLF